MERLSLWLLYQYSWCQNVSHWHFNINTSYQYRKSHCGDKTNVRVVYHHNGNSDIGKTAYIYTVSAFKSKAAIAVSTHWGWVTHICVGNLTIIGSDNGLLPDPRQAIIWTKAGILSIRHLGTNFSEISINILRFSFKKMRFQMSSAKWRPFCLGLNVSKLSRNISISAPVGLIASNSGTCRGGNVTNRHGLNKIRQNKTMNNAEDHNHGMPQQFYYAIRMHLLPEHQIKF